MAGTVVSTLALAVGALAAAATDFRASVRGRITWQGGDGLAGAVVELRCQGVPPIARSAHTDTHGEFSLDQLPGGACRALARAESFEPSEPMVFNLVAGEQRRLDVVLVPEPPSRSRSPAYTPGLDDGLPLPVQRLEALIQLGGGLDGDRGPGGGVTGARHFGAGYTLDGFDVGDPMASGLGARIPEWALVALTTGPTAFDLGASIASGAATNLIAMSGSNKPEISFRESALMATADPGTGWASDLGMLMAGPLVLDRAWFMGTGSVLAGRAGTDDKVVAASGLARLTWQVNARNKLSTLLVADQGSRDDRDVRRTFLAGARWESLITDALVASAQLAWREGAPSGGSFQGAEAGTRVDWFLGDRFGDSQLIVAARASSLEAEPEGSSAVGSLERSLVRVEHVWRPIRWLTLHLGAAWSASRFRRDGHQVVGGSGAWPAPHASLAWDATSDGRTAVRVSAAEVVDLGSVVTGEAAIAAGEASCRASTRELGAGVEREVIAGSSVELEGSLRRRPCQLPGDERAATHQQVGLHLRQREGRVRVHGHGHLERGADGVVGRLRFSGRAALTRGLSAGVVVAWDDPRAWTPLMDLSTDPPVDPNVPPMDPRALPMGDRRRTLVGGVQAWFALGTALGLPWALSSEAFVVGRQRLIRLRLVQSL